MRGLSSGRENRLKEAPFTDLSRLVTTLCEVLEPELSPPFAFFGHSMGATIAFEMARQLRRRRSPSPVRLFVSARVAPHVQDPRPPLHLLPQNVFWSELQDRYGSYSAFVSQDDQLKALFFPLLRADLQLTETYAYRDESPLTCPITVFGGRQDDLRSEQLEAWNKYTEAPCDVHMFPGDHFFLKNQRDSLVKAISSHLLQDLGSPPKS